MIKIISDSTCDLSPSLVKKYNIDILPLYIHLGDDEYKDGVNIKADDIYVWSDKNNATPKTSAPSIEDAILAIQPYREQNADVIMFSISKDMSTTANVMRMAAEELKYSDHVFVIDSENLSTGISLLVIEAATMIKKGIQVEEIVGRIQALKPYVRASFVVDTLTYLHRGGRCSATTSLFGNVLRLKPRIFVQAGKMEAGQKYRGKQSKVIPQYVKDMESELRKAKKDRVFITHSGCDNDIIETVRNYLKSLNCFREILITRAGGVISSHCGPGTLGVLYIEGAKKYGPYDKDFDANHNGFMEEDEMAAEAAYIRHIREEEKARGDSSESDDYDEEKGTILE